MLQQTQVTTVVPYYERFLKEFPTPWHLAEAPLDQVLKAWEGLGYYARARNLKRAAEQIVRCHGGSLPEEAPLLMDLPGIGRSTAGAILSIGFGQRSPILDGNVRRVLCRYFAIREDPRAKPIEEVLWRYSEVLMPRGNPGAFCQAIMDLGAMVCTPKRPRCGDCPVARSCEGYRLGIQESLPQSKRKKAVPRFRHVAGMLLRRGRLLLRRRPSHGLLGGLWEFPGGRLADLEAPAEGAARILFAELNTVPLFESEIGKVHHTFTHFKMTLHVCRFALEGDLDALPEHFRWVDPGNLGAFALSAAQLKALELFKSASSGQRLLF